MIELKNVNKFYNSNGVTNLGLRNINLEFNKNEIVAITGDSGSGKSTLLNVITKIDTFDDGEIYYKGNETSYFSISDMDDFRKNKVGFIFQNYNIIDSYTVLENVMVPLLLRGFSKSEASVKAKNLIDKVGLTNRIKNRGSKLSGGEKQRCVIARALASDCEILACDEPTGNLDSKTGKEIIDLIKEISKDKLVLIVTHDYSLVEAIATRKIRISDGEVVEDTRFKAFPKDEDEVLDLDYKPMAKKIKAKIAKNNVIFTPRKTIFTTLIFFVIFFITIFLFQLVYYSNQSMDVDNIYLNHQSDRCYIYTKDRCEIDKNEISKISDKYVINPFYEDKDTILDFSSDLYSYYSHRGFYAKYPTNYKMIDGRLPNDGEKEVLLIIPNGYINSLDNIKSFNYLNVGKDKYHVVGYAQSNTYDDNFVVSGNDDLLNTIRNSFTTIQTTINIDKETINVKASISNNVDLLKICLPKKYEGMNLSIFSTINDLYNFSDYEVKYYNGSSISVEANFTNILNKYSFEASIYSSNISKVKKSIKALGYQIDIPSKLDNGETINTFVNNLTGYLSIIACSLLLVIVFFITYFILAKVYSSKKNDYEILRTLGITQSDMKTIVYYEVFMVGCMGLALGFLSALIIMYSVIELNVLVPIKFVTIIIYLLVSLLFIYKIGKRFNRRLFKFSVVSSLKGDDFFD